VGVKRVALSSGVSFVRWVRRALSRWCGDVLSSACCVGVFACLLLFAFFVYFLFFVFATFFCCGLAARNVH
jgi:hypothetical protein